MNGDAPYSKTEGKGVLAVSNLEVCFSSIFIACSKAAMESITIALAAELAPHKVLLVIIVMFVTGSNRHFRYSLPDAWFR